uniref:ULP_PROTEASE domain-containing protein n=1 Tax=Mesocestoides corti TaxID=53468 RepID=A0A0R3U801_MESCO
LSYHTLFSICIFLPTLDGWVTDNIIQFAGEVIETNYGLRSPSRKILVLHPVASMFVRKNADDILPHLNCDEKEWIFCPLNNASENEPKGSHWYLLIVSRELGMSFYLDSLLPLHHNLRNSSGEIRRAEETNNAIYLRILPCIKQTNSIDCGIYVILYIYLICDLLLKGDLSWVNVGLVGENLTSVALSLRKRLKGEVDAYLKNR